MLLAVSARDGGGLGSTVNAVVTVKILQTAVAPAVFERSRYTFSIPEDAPEGSAVGTVKAREPLSKWPWKTFRQIPVPPDLLQATNICSQYCVKCYFYSFSGEKHTTKCETRF